MVTTNKKLIKEIKSIISSSENAKKLAEQELDKIDAKYKALAEKEKSDLSKTLKLLDTQIASYRSMLCDNGPCGNNAEETEPEPEIVDTVFHENNGAAECEEKEEEVPDTADEKEQSTDEPEQEQSSPADADGDGGEDLEWPEDSGNEQQEASDAGAENSDDEGEWPDEPEEWN